jgi:hypothetical protein
MHLLNTSTITLLDVNSDKPPAYAILSHRWEESEVTFQDMKDGTGVSKVGYAKIVGCCAQAVEDGWKYVWIDSCCIDKSSSAELSEAINSMFRWYRDAQVCYAYLCDVPHTKDSHYAKNSAFCRSKWFTRGWTLQELLAPEIVVFFSQTWAEIGTKSSLAPLISEITSIDNLFSFQKACVAQKMSWAARRQTTRVEDTAYCLMGLFDVNMPLIYGEGDKAFVRLQLEILSSVDDESIFAWAKPLRRQWEFNAPGTKSYNIPFVTQSGLLASSPGVFEFSGDVQRVGFDWTRPPFSMTNKGLRIEPLLIQSKLLSSIFEPGKDWPDPDDNLYAMPLNCGRIGSNEYLSVYLRQSGPQFLRAGPSKLTMFRMRRDSNITVALDAAFQRSIVFVKQQTQFFEKNLDYPTALKYEFAIRKGSLFSHGILLTNRFMHNPSSMNYWDDYAIDESLLVLYGDNSSAELRFSENCSEVFCLALKCDASGILIDILVPDENQSFNDLVQLFTSKRILQSPVDRISKCLPSGKAVSVALRKKGGSTASKKYSIEITVDPDGYIQWPEMVKSHRAESGTCSRKSIF